MLTIVPSPFAGINNSVLHLPSVAAVYSCKTAKPAAKKPAVAKTAKPAAPKAAAKPAAPKAVAPKSSSKPAAQNEQQTCSSKTAAKPAAPKAAAKPAAPKAIKTDKK
ncbi:MAG: hypothetical protein IPL63_14470 [Saprospiraceae bacterium]|nr:hypothetical protein [Saprospiraceae bacterium]